MAGPERDERADGPAPEHEHEVVRPHLGALHVVGRDGQRLDHRGLVVRERRGHLQQARRRHRAVLAHAARQLHADDLERIAEVGGAHPAGAAGSAEREWLEDNTVAGREAARRGRLDDLGERLVADHAALRHAMVEVALEDVQIGAADADAADSQEGLGRPGRRERRLADREGPRSLIERGAQRLLDLGVALRGHAAVEGAVLAALLEREPEDVQEPAEDEVGSGADQQGAVRAEVFVGRHLLR